MNTHSLPSTAPWQKNTSLFYAAVLLIFIVAMGVRWQYMTHKTFVHLDESFSITLSTFNAPSWNERFEDGVVYEGDELRRQAYTVSSGLAGLGHDLFRMRMDSRDPPHSNLYYTFYRTALSGMDNWDTYKLLWRGCLLNLVFFAVSFGLLLQLARLIFAEDRSTILLALLVAVLNPATLSCSLFVRPYQMQEALFIGMALMTVWYVLRIRAGQPCPGYGLFFAHALAICLCLLSGYFAFFYIPLLGLVLLYESLARHQQAYIPYFITLTFLGVLLGWSLYASFMVSLFIDRGVEASEKILGSYLLDHAAFLFDKFTYNLARYGMGTAGAVLLGCAALLSYGRLWAAHPRARLALTLLLVCCVWSIAVFSVAPYKNMRYFMPAVPLILLFACALLQYARFRQFLMPLLACCVLFQTFVAGNIEFYKGAPPIAPQDAPYVASFTEIWRPSAFIPYIEDKQKIIFYDDCEKLRAALPQHAGTYLLIDAPKFQQCRMADVPALRSVREEPYFFVYKIEESPATSGRSPS